MDAAQYGDFGYSADGSAITITMYTGRGPTATIPSTIPGVTGTVTFIGDLAFSNALVRAVAIPSSVTSIGIGAFSRSQLASVTIPNSVTNIGDSAFDTCHRLTSVVIPNSVTSIGPSTFNWCPLLTSLTLPSSVTSVGYNAFYDCYGLTNVSFGNSFTNIGVEAFFACSGLTSLALPNSLTSISAWAFGSCQGLTKVSIPNSVTSIGDYAFDYCRALTNVFFQGNAPASFARSAFAETVNAFTVYYPATATGFSTPTWNGYPAFPYSPIQPPQAQTKIGGFGVSANGFGFNITAPSNTVVVVQASTNLANSNWYPLATNAITSGSAYFSDPQGINQPCRFYRLLLP